MFEFLTHHPVLCYIFGIFFVFFFGLILGLLLSRSKIKKARKDAVVRSRAVIGGQMTEQIAPFLPEFPCNPSDCRFLGKPVDFVAFSGMAQDEEVSEILFVEVKTGKSALSSREKQIKKCVEEGRVRYIEYRI